MGPWPCRVPGVLGAATPALPAPSLAQLCPDPLLRVNGGNLLPGAFLASLCLSCACAAAAGLFTLFKPQLLLPKRAPCTLGFGIGT